MVRCMEQWLAQQPHLPPTAPLFPCTDGTQMSADTPRGRLQAWLRATGEEEWEQYGFHSLRAGGATQAASSGVPDRLIQQAGNWQSDAYRLYIRPDEAERVRVAAALGDA